VPSPTTPPLRHTIAHARPAQRQIEAGVPAAPQLGCNRSHGLFRPCAANPARIKRNAGDVARNNTAHEGPQTMLEYLQTWLALKADRRAVTALEYGVIAGVLAVVVVTAFTTLGGGLNTAFTNISNQL
jgi:pilus assembly protein Flp/PilA